MAQKKYLIRFVGGIWHNRIEECYLRPYYEVVTREPLKVFKYLHEISINKEDISQIIEKYELYSYVTDRGTKYLQYIHQSVKHDERCNFNEIFKPLPEWMFTDFEWKLYSALDRGIKEN